MLDLHENYPTAIKSYNWTKGLIRSRLVMAEKWEKLEGPYLKMANHIIVLSEDFNVPHGSACAFTLLDIYKMSSSIESVKDALAKIAKAFFNDSDKDILISKLYDKLENMFKDMKLPTNFKELGVEISEADIDSHFSRAFDDPKMWNQIPKATKENIYPFLVIKC